jgi:hypothetical protein
MQEKTKEWRADLAVMKTVSVKWTNSSNWHFIEGITRFSQRIHFLEEKLLRRICQALIIAAKGMLMAKTIEDVAEQLIDNGNNRKTALLIGAGCSKEAGIPTASEFELIIKSKFEKIYEKTEIKNIINLCLLCLMIKGTT